MALLDAIEDGKGVGSSSMLPATIRPNLESESSSEDSTDLLSTVNGEGWENGEVESEEEAEYVSLLDTKKFTRLDEMLHYCKEEFDLDLLKTCHDFELGDLDIIKLINYIRFEAKNGNMKPDVSRKILFEDENHLMPTMQDDALLMAIDDILSLAERDHPRSQLEKPRVDGVRHGDKTCEELLQDAQGENKDLRAQLALAQKVLNEHYNDNLRDFETGKRGPNASEQMAEDDSHYFKSYENNEIHDVMLKDTVRTEAYRDFIYGNKHLFKDKVVLDVGCGTGILSMFCARAGAQKVIAVDNSEILHKCLRNVWENNLEKVITCQFGRIEEVGLAVKEVDIIVSEWMGYCLLYEAMLDSVLYARDHYLKPGGLMIPSHCTLRIAPVMDPDYVAANVNFWKSVYGFAMSSMLDSAGDDVVVRQFEDVHLAGPSVPFLHLPLRTCTVKDLSFAGVKLKMELDKDADKLDGFAIWFDTFFTTTPTSKIEPEDITAEDWKGTPHDKDDELKGMDLAFTTGPHGKGTHWQQGMLMITHLKGQGQAASLRKSQVIEATIGYKKRKANSRELDIEVKWDAGEEDGQGRRECGQQIWFMR